MLELLELLLVHLGLLVILVDNTLDDLKTVLHIIHRLGEERGEVVVLHLTENAIISGDLQLGTLNSELKVCDFFLELSKFKVNDGSLTEVDRPFDEGRVR